MKKLIKELLGLLIIGMLIIMGCNKDPLKNYHIEGKAQKGPFIIGTNITISELDENLNQTGKSISSTIIDDQGKFDVPEFEFASNYVLLTADGYYFNEISGPGYVTSEKLVLKSIANLNETRTININILTHLEVERLKFLVMEGNQSFQHAKKQSYEEILNIFNMHPEEEITSEKLDISEKGQENDELLVISSIVHGYRNPAQLTEFLTRLQLDIKEDGLLDSESLQSDLITTAVLLNCDQISQNLINRYSDLGLEIPVPDSRPIVDSFLANSHFQKLVEIDFPQSTELGTNILNLGDTVEIDTNENYCISLNQVCNVNYLQTYLNFGDISGLDTILNFQDVQITNIQNWGDPSSDTHLFGSRDQISFYKQDFSGNLNLQIEFRDHGSLLLKLDFGAREYGQKSKMQYIFW